MPDDLQSSTPATLYSVDAVSTGGGRDGHVRTSDGAIDLDMRAPRALGGSGQGANPEQLFAAGFASCFHSALLLAARREKVTVEDSSVGARVAIVNGPAGLDLTVKLEVVLPGLAAQEARRLADLAETLCPYSRATRDNIQVSIVVSDD